MKRNYYQILNIPINARPFEVKQAYRKLALEHHPDRNLNNKFAQALMDEINEAYATLRDFHKRREYDKSLPKSAKEATYYNMQLLIDSFLDGL